MSSASFPRRLNRQDGYTLIETLVVISITSILAVASVTMISGSFNSNLRAFQQATQLTSQHQLFGYLNARLSHASTLGAPEVSDSLSTTPDQLLFMADGDCYRVFVQIELGEVRDAKAPSCSDPLIAPVRRPNETVPVSVRAEGSTTRIDPAERDDPEAQDVYDPALDDPTASFALTSGVRDTGNSGETSPLFKYLDTGGQEADPAEAAGVRVTAYLAPLGSDPATSSPGAVAARTAAQVIWIGQGGGTTPPAS